MQEPSVETVSPEQETAKMSFFQRLTGVFSEPTKTFQDINLKPTWFLIFLVLAVLTCVNGYFTNKKADAGATIRAFMEWIPFKLPEEAIDQYAEQAVAQQQNQSLASQVLNLGGTVIAILATLVIKAGFFILLFLIMGARLKFKKSLAISAWAASPPTIVHSILSIIVLFFKEPGSVDATEGAVIANLGLLIDSKAHAVLHSILSSIDLFAIWSIILLSLGYAAISDKKLTPKKAATALVVLMVVFIIIKAGYRAIISG
jgi:hypothetical protein